MAQLQLAVSRTNRDHSVMAQNVVDFEDGAFESDTIRVVARLKRDLANLVAAVSASRPSDLQKILQLDTTLAYKIYRVIGERNCLAASISVPSRVAIERVASRAAEKGAAPELIDFLIEAYRDFESLVEKHAGDRNSFNTLATNVAGVSAEWLNANAQDRKSVFRGLSHLVGFEARARLASFFFVPGNGVRHNFALVSGYSGLRTLRRVDRVRVHGVHIERTSVDDPIDFAMKPLELAGSPDSYLLSSYSQPKSPALDVATKVIGDHRWVQTSLVRPQIGNTGSSTVLFGEKLRSAEMADRVEDHLTIPAELQVVDLIVVPGMIQVTPRLEIFLGEDKPAFRLADTLPIEGNHMIELRGRGSEVAAIPELADYPALIREVAHELGQNISDMEVWRVRIEYPVYQSTVRVSW